MWRANKKPRQPFEAICVIACSTIAEGSGRMVSSTPIRISPPAMPNRPDRNAVATISRPRAAIISGVMRISENISALLVLLSQTELSWPGVSFPEGGVDAAAAVSQRHQGVRGRGTERKLCRRGRRAQRVGGGGQPDGASSGAAAPRWAVRTPGPPAGDDRFGGPPPERS